MHSFIVSVILTMVGVVVTKCYKATISKHPPVSSSAINILININDLNFTLHLKFTYKEILQ